MIWQDASWLWLLLLIPLLGLGILLLGRLREQRLLRYFDAELLGRIRLGSWPFGRRLRTGLLMGSAFLFILGLAGPMIGTEIREMESRGLDMVVVLDLSRSMNAEDIRPSRLEKAKFEIGRLIDRSPGDRIGLVVFTGQAFVQAPLTVDHSALRMFLDIANTDQMPGGTTNFRSAMETVHEMFSRIEERPDAARVMLLFSDGEDHGPGFGSALSALAGSGVLIYTVGIGTPEGGRIPVYDERGELSHYHRDRQGREVVTALEPGTMREIANRGGGSYYEILNTSAGIDPFLSHLDELQRGEVAVETIADYSNRYQVLLLLGLALFVTAMLLPVSRPQVNGRFASFSSS